MPEMLRDISGDELIKRLEKFGYEVVRRSGSHVRLQKGSYLTRKIQLKWIEFRIFMRHFKILLVKCPSFHSFNFIDFRNDCFSPFIQ